ncbi:MAG: hypothetical protein ACD_73C00045G0001, partial [uncultured bacterium]
MGDREAARAAAKKVGFPVMAKVSDAGGGRGMHMFWNESDFDIPAPGSDKKDKWADLESTASNNGSNIFIMQLALQRQEILDLQAGFDAAKDFGYPAYLKLGNEVVKCENEEEIQSAFERFLSVLSQLRASGDEETKLEILGGGQRHIEVQVLAD